ncbi:MAG: hypothetical protein R6W93_13645, partial [Candidatus Limnocylindrales bacterium]
TGSWVTSIELARVSRRIARVSWRPEEVAAMLRDFAAEGIGHVQLVIDPITPAGVESLAPILEALDAA